MPVRIFCLTLIFSAFVVSCNKKPPVLPPAPEQPGSVIILLNNPYMNGTKVDSAIATWTVNNRKQEFKLNLHNDTLSASADTLTAGKGKLTVKLFSKIKFKGQYSSQWVLEKEQVISPKNELKLAGPTSYNDVNWSPRVVLKDGIGHVAVVALRPEDPYFFINDVQNNVLELLVAREYWKTKEGVNLVAGKEWHCTTNCRDANGDVENSDFFKTLPGQIGTRTWNHIEIVILYRDNQQGGGYVLDFNYDVE